MHVLVVYYSYSQQTRRVATTIGETLEAQGHEVTRAALDFDDPHYGDRFTRMPMKFPIAKIVGMLPGQVRRRTCAIKIPPEADAGDYDLVVIGSPTWWLTTCMPVRSYLHHDAAKRVLADTPFAAYTTSRRYWKNNVKTIRELGKQNGGSFVDATHFLAEGNQVMSMWSWLAFMRHGEPRSRSFGVHMPPPNLKVDFETQARTFINEVADRAPKPS
jgi:menaquinone-dependent protoporphyrinogen IX oxidase